MDLASALSSIIDAALAAGTPLDLFAQVAVLLVVVMAAFLVRSRWNRAIDARASDSESSSARLLVLHASKRVSFALTLTAGTLLAQGLFEALERPSGLLIIAVPLTLALAAVRTLVYLLRVAAGPGGGTRRMELLFSVTLWFVCALYFLGWLPVVAGALDGVGASFGEVRITLLVVVKFLILSGLLVLTALALSRLVEGRLTAGQNVDSGVRVGFVKAIRYGLVGFAVLLALSVAGFDLTTLTVVGGALGVGIGFGLQKVASNLISGFLLLFDRSIRPGDVITIGENYGWVTKMSARYLVVRDLDGVDTLIPNEELITSQVKNWSYGDRHIRIKLLVQISYDDDPELAMKLLLEASGASDRVIADPPPAAFLLGFGDNGIDLQLSVWIDDPERGVNSVRTEINLAIWQAFKTNGITIPFPQRDLHVNTAYADVTDGRDDS